MLEAGAGAVYTSPMADATHPVEAASGWLEALTESETELAVGLNVRAAVVYQRIRDSIPSGGGQTVGCLNRNVVAGR